jgi:hypothetical protein
MRDCFYCIVEEDARPNSHNRHRVEVSAKIFKFNSSPLVFIWTLGTGTAGDVPVEPS